MVNQFIETHQSAWTYTGGVLQSSQTTGTGVYQSTQSQYLSQAFITGSSQTTIGTVSIQVSTVGGSPTTPTITPLVVSLYLSDSGIPTGSALGSVSLTEQLVYASPFFVQVPLNVMALTPNTEYCIVVNQADSATQYYVWQQSNQTAGAATSADNVNWSPQNFGLMYEVFDETGLSGLPITITDDGGSRITNITYNTMGQIATLTEQTIAQDGTFLLSTRTFTYNGNVLIGVS